MAKKLFLNVAYTIGIFIALIIGYQYGIEQKQYPYLIGAIIIMVIFIVLKIRLIQEIKNTQKKP